ncbi:type I methionyl aminopeptidase [soil metagenome]
MPAIPIKNAREIAQMRVACECARDILLTLAAMVRPGVSTLTIDTAAGELIGEAGGVSAFLGYRGFPANTCISVNEEVVHGIGRANKIIQNGDIVKIDVGVIKDGWVGDNATTIPVGPIRPEVHQLLAATEEALHAAISHAAEGEMLGTLCNAVEEHVRPFGFSVVREFVGHGVGRKLHEEPQIPNFGKRGSKPRLKAGMILAIEPMVNLGTARVNVLDDNWTVVTKDGLPSAHFEHTVLVTKDGPEILTPRRRLTAPQHAHA